MYACAIGLMHQASTTALAHLEVAYALVATVNHLERPRAVQRMRRVGSVTALPTIAVTHGAGEPIAQAHHAVALTSAHA